MNIRTSGALCAASIAAILAAQPVLAQDTRLEEIVVTPNRAPTEATKTGSRVETVSREEIEEKAQPLVIDYLDRLPGISISTPGSIGGEGSLSVRGAPRRYVKTLYNGIDIADPTSPQVQTSYQYLLSGGIDSIEVLKGSQSTLYGSDAIAGVISLSTLGEIDPGVTHLVRGEGGSFGTARGSYGFRAAGENGKAAVNIAGFRTDGISSAAAGTERDGFENVTFDAAGEYQLNDMFSVFGSLLYIDAEAEYDVDRYVDSFTGEVIEPQDSLENVNSSEQLGARVGFNVNLLDDRLKNTFSIQHFELDRGIRSDHPVFGRFDADYRGTRVKADYIGSFEATDWLTFQYGADHEKQTARAMESLGTPFESDDENSFSIAGIWGQSIIEPVENLVFSAGLRQDDHSEFGGHTTYRGSASYLIENSGTRLHSSVGTGFRAPSLYELFGPFVGNPTLDPETSFSFDVGVEQRFLDDRIIADVTFFTLDIDDLITFSNATFVYEQTPGTTKSRGVEASVTWQANSWLDLDANYTYTETEMPGGQRNVRVPRHMVGLGATVRPAEKWTVSASAKIAVDAEDEITVGSVAGPFGGFTGVTGRVKLDDYVLVNAKIAYQATESTEFYVRAENLLDQDYQAVRGYNTPGIAAFAGFKSRF